MVKQCLICEQEIQTDNRLGPQGATIWTSKGNYGSSVYDPMTGSVFLEALICDACLVRKKGLIEEVKLRKTIEEVERRSPTF